LLTIAPTKKLTAVTIENRLTKRVPANDCEIISVGFSENANRRRCADIVSF